jgi:hypothetical protein
MIDPRASGVRKWGCSECKGIEFEDQDHRRRERNCEGGGRPLALEYDDTITRCPWSDFDPEVAWYVQSWIDWDRWRVLPLGGELMDYPYSFYQALGALESTKAEVVESSRDRESKRLELERKRSARR